MARITRRAPELSVSAALCILTLTAGRAGSLIDRLLAPASAEARYDSFRAPSAQKVSELSLKTAAAARSSAVVLFCPAQTLVLMRQKSVLSLENKLAWCCLE